MGTHLLADVFYCQKLFSSFFCYRNLAITISDVVIPTCNPLDDVVRHQRSRATCLLLPLLPRWAAFHQSRPTERPPTTYRKSRRIMRAKKRGGQLGRECRRRKANQNSGIPWPFGWGRGSPKIYGIFCCRSDLRTLSPLFLTFPILRML